MFHAPLEAALDCPDGFHLPLVGRLVDDADYLVDGAGHVAQNLVVRVAEAVHVVVDVVFVTQQHVFDHGFDNVGQVVCVCSGER